MPEWTVECRWERTREQSSLDGGQLFRKVDHDPLSSPPMLSRSVGTETVCGRVLSHGLSLQHLHTECTGSMEWLQIEREVHGLTTRGALLLDHALDIP